MCTINLVDNLVLQKGILRAKGREGQQSRVFLRQGQLDGACGVYSLMMMLMIHQKINRKDLDSKSLSESPSSVRRLKTTFFNGSKRILRSGSTFDELRIKLLQTFGKQIKPNVYTTHPSKGEALEVEELHQKIKEQLDAKQPVQIGYYWNPKDHGHSVVAIGYSISDDILRLYCLDPSFTLPYTSMWNNIIDLNMNYDNEERRDYDHMSEGPIIVDEVLLIEDTEKTNLFPSFCGLDKPIGECPF